MKGVLHGHEQPFNAALAKNRARQHADAFGPRFQPRESETGTHNLDNVF
jgi:hypothetical protein